MQWIEYPVLLKGLGLGLMGRGGGARLELGLAVCPNLYGQVLQVGQLQILGTPFSSHMHPVDLCSSRDRTAKKL